MSEYSDDSPPVQVVGAEQLVHWLPQSTDYGDMLVLRCIRVPAQLVGGLPENRLETARGAWTGPGAGRQRALLLAWLYISRTKYA